MLSQSRDTVIVSLKAHRPEVVGRRLGTDSERELIVLKHLAQ